jgi:Fe-S-cluster containining protein
MGIALELKEWQQEFLSPFCLEECIDNTCCCGEKTAILMTEKQLRRAYGIKSQKDIPQSKKDDLFGFREDGTPVYAVLTYHTKNHPYCPAYNPETRICGLESNKPRFCRIYPVMIESHVIQLSASCNIAKTDNKVKRRLEEIARLHSHELKLMTARISLPKLKNRK